jgi:hypothetical protein
MFIHANERSSVPIQALLDTTGNYPIFFPPSKYMMGVYPGEIMQQPTLSNQSPVQANFGMKIVNNNQMGVYSPMEPNLPNACYTYGTSTQTSNGLSATPRLMPYQMPSPQEAVSRLSSPRKAAMAVSPKKA